MRVMVAIIVALSWPFMIIGQETSYSFSQLDISQGLSNNQINSIYKDHRGFMWFGTNAGLNRYDGYSFKKYRHNEQDSATIGDDQVFTIFEGPEKLIWIRTQSTFNLYDPLTEKVSRRSDLYLLSKGLPKDGLVTILKDGETFYFVYGDAGVYEYKSDGAVRQIRHTRIEKGPPNPITSAGIDSKKYLWVVRYNGLLEKLDTDHGKRLVQTQILQKQPVKGYQPLTMFIDNQDDIWMYQKSSTQGVYYYHTERNSVQLINTESKPLALSSNTVTGIAQDPEGQIWVITDHGGLNIINKQKNEVRVFRSKEGDPTAIAENALYSVYRDDLGIMWLGSYKKGISYYDRNSIRFPLVRHRPADPASLPFEDVNAFVEDRLGNLWIGSNGGGLIYFDRRKNSFKQYRHDPANPNSLGNNVIVSLCLDHQDKLWIGTYQGGLDCFDGTKFTHYRHDENDPHSIADNNVFSIYEDRNHNLWVGMLNSGLDRFDRKTGKFYHHNLTVPNTLHHDNVTTLTEDARGNLWIGTSWGIDVLDKSSGRFINYTSENSRLSYNSVNGILEDHNGNVWVATHRGLNVLPRGKSEFMSFYAKDGLPDNTILDILQDNQHNLWVSTKSGLAKIEVIAASDRPWMIRCTNFTEHEGLQGREFNRYAAYKTRSGELLFGGAYGFNLFDPSKIKSVYSTPPVVLTDFQLFNRSVPVGETVNNRKVLERSISEVDILRLAHNQNDFSFEFAALGYSNAAKTRYAYMLEGFNKEWIIPNGNTRTATYTNIDPGEYVFRVKVSNDDGTWNEQGLALKILIAPPFWKTGWAYLLYTVVLAGLFYFLRRQIIRREQVRMQLQVERQEAQRIRELDEMKTRFFTNVSHEFRTPISLIMIPIQRLIKETPAGEMRSQFELIHRNARRLLNMVNELLDFRRLQENELKLHATESDIVQYIQEVAASFNDMANNKAIEYRYQGLTSPVLMYFDRDKLERILFNLLSNAFKFTPERGQVTVEVGLAAGRPQDWLEIRVKDTGIGIPEDQHEKIFERFYQTSSHEHILNQGSGIGLSITREFVELHGGTITVSDVEPRGTCFTVLLPIRRPADQVAPIAAASLSYAAQPQVLKKPTILLVEDNDDFRTYLRNSLQEHFTIIEAVQGMEGWKKVLSSHPDLVVSDINMPLLSGIELCRKMKQDARTRHIPIILLTALGGEDTQLKALETGPNDYITKPFNYDILLSRIRNLLNYQLVVKETYQKLVEVNPSAPVPEEEEEDQFIKRALAVIEENMGNSDFNVDNLRQELLLSRTSLYKKVLALTGQTPIEFIRQIRLKRAAQLLEKTNHNITEVAYMVGFNNPKYFAKYFKEQFGQLPSQYQQERKSKNLSSNGSFPAG
jgi:signal transduction histidine kinase/ligand-binding sensor domain-containing protein/DNA-binding response OmpR family regulator